MAYQRLPEPGSDLGPCREPCTHRDCAATRRQAASRCAWCGEPIGYDRPFNQPLPDRLEHWDCALDAEDTRRAALRESRTP